MIGERMEVEEALLGSILAFAQLEDAGEALQTLTEKHFAVKDHAAVLQAIRSLHTPGKALDLKALQLELTTTLENPGPFIGELMNSARHDTIPSLIRALELQAERDREQKREREAREAAKRLVRDTAQRLDDSTVDPTAALEYMAEAIRDMRTTDDPIGDAVPITLAQLLTDPEITAPPKAVFDRIAWEARTTLFASREKSGKSTLMAYVAAVVSRRGPVLILCLEEHPGDVARNLMRFGPKPENVFVLTHHDGGFDELHRLVDRLGPVLVIVDTLEEFVKQQGLAMQAGDDPQWTPVMSGFREVAHATNAAVVIVHHANKSDGRARGSTRITAGVEAVLEMSVDEATEARQFRTVARWDTKPFSLVLETDEDGPDRFEFPSAEPSLEVRILDFIERKPGCSKRDLRDIPGSNGTIDRLVMKLVNTGLVENRGAGNGHAYFRAGHGSGTLFGTPENSENSTSSEAM